MKKVYARQIPPEHQESPLFLGDEFWPDDVILDGNRYLNSHTIPAYDHINRYFDEMAGEWENDGCYYVPIGYGYRQHPKKHDYTIGEILRDYGFTREDGKPWSNQQKHKWRVFLEGNGPADESQGMCELLELITGKEWTRTTIRGVCQGDWQTMYHPADWTRTQVEIFETEYFNTGSGWMIHDEETDPETPEEISGFCMYCHGWNDDDIRAEIAEETNADPADIVLYKFSSWKRSATYEIA